MLRFYFTLFISFIILLVFTECCQTKKAIIQRPKEKKEYRYKFSSGFEGSVQVSENKVRNKVWVQTIQGIDSETGARWPNDLPGDASKSIFIYLISEEHKPTDWVHSEIRKTTAHDGSTTKALYQEVKKPGKSYNSSLVRNQFGLVNNSNNTFHHIKVKYRIKLQENLEAVMPGKSWRQLMEIRGVDNEFRISMTLNRFDSNAPISWKIEAENGSDWKNNKPLWVESNFNKNYDLINPEVPIGEWFYLEFELIRKPNESGRLICRVNNEVLVDKTGITSSKSGLHTWHMFKVYASENALKKGKHYQWIDDVEVTVY